ncbi:acyl-CoA thioesterase [Mycolicibacterium fluoranthenivorans]|uniref:Acyl-CoA thioesterase n=1 Tax=Mycolicibacterium fluoranthenivorans TaxID=258505 RepID=A0A7G8PNE5_9MYCO|nr:acyl-CoA thioesterase [Mycolicibacterium fluoranthenivorans]
MSSPLRIEPRWTDLDPVGHVNNSVFLVYAEEARARFLYAELPGTWQHIVVVHNSIDYHSSVVVTDVVHVTSTVGSIGRTSFTTVNEIATDEGRRCATVRTVQVVLDPDGQHPRPWTDLERAALSELSGTPASP